MLPDANRRSGMVEYGSAMLLALTLAPAAMAAEKQPKGDRVELAAEARRALFDQASRMAEAALRSDHVAFTDFMYPRVVREAGGREAMVAKLQQMERGMKADGAQIVESKVIKVLACVQTPKQVQCVLDQRQGIRVRDGLIRNQSDLLAFSDDLGKRWTFLGAGQSPAAIRSFLPELSPVLPLRDPIPPRLERQ